MAAAGQDRPGGADPAVHRALPARRARRRDLEHAGADRARARGQAGRDRGCDRGHDRRGAGHLRDLARPADRAALPAAGPGQDGRPARPPLRDGGADLAGADLSGADLSGADQAGRSGTADRAASEPGERLHPAAARGRPAEP
ncbi:pentapeptide repeat-containing protein [Nonomuraea sp. bgisy101]|uniref:pentapeptide repeat-containing protein n=1 Tax=Nonomuraea sp. bgisy101 TaxID=3413784 RepID=UPI003D74412B